MKQKLRKQIITARATDEEYEIIQQRAKEQNIPVSRYLVEAAIKVEGMPLSMRRSIYRELEIIKDVVRHEKNHSVCVEIVERGCDYLWRSLK